MATDAPASLARDFARLFDQGALIGLPDGTLLDRFVRGEDDAAFEALVARHGAMVRGICRRILGDPHAADDAFQATFLVLVKKARKLREAQALGPWLFGVARRVALRARRTQMREDRRMRSPRLGLLQNRHGMADHERDADRASVRAVLDFELGRLPERERTPLILCYLEGRTHEEAAQQLHWPVGTVRSRLARGRDTLRQRLRRRGFVLSSVALAALLSAESTSAACHLPSTLVAATLASARTVVLTPSLASAGLTPHVAEWTRGALMTMTLSESKMPLAFVLATCLVAGGSFTHAQRAGSGTGRAASEKAVDPDDTKAELDRRADLIRSLERKLKSLEEEVAALRESAGPDFGARDRANAEADPFGAPAANSSRAEARGSANASGRAQGTASGRTGGAAAEGGFVGQGGRGAGFGPRGAAGMMGSDPFRGGRGAMGGAGRAAQGDPFQQNQGSLLPQGNAADPVNRRGGLMGRGMGGMMGGAGMGDMSRMMGMMGGGMAAPEGLRYTHSGGVHALQTDDKRVVTAYSVEHDTAAVYEAPEGVTLEPIIGADVLAPLYEGGKATELAVFSAKQGRWFTERLEQPADAIEGPLVGTGLVAYRVGPRVYAFSGEAGRWGVITPQTRDGEQSVPILGPSVVTLIDGKSIHLFSRKTGNWTTLRAEGTNPEANDPNARGRREAPPTDLEK